MRRREFIIALGGAAVTPLTAQAQRAKLPTVGLLIAGTPTSHGVWVAALVQRMRELGWIEDRTVAIEYRWAGGQNERIAAIVEELVRIKVDVIVTHGVALTAAKQATSVIPIVFPLANDPIGTGLVASLARPGGNLTGLSTQQADLIGKRLELLRELVANFRTLAIMGNVDNPAAWAEVRQVQAMARSIGVEVVTLDIRGAEDIDQGFEALKGRGDALYVASDSLVHAHRARINTLALGARLPTMHGFREFVEAGGLISYAANFSDLFRRAGDYVDRILRGTKPEDLPIEQPTKYDLVLNLTTAKTLGLMVSPTLLARVDEVVE